MSGPVPLPPRSGFLARRLAGFRRWVRAPLAGSGGGTAPFRATRFRLLPPHLLLSDPSVAADFVAGQVVLAGKGLLTNGRPPFDFRPPSAAFGDALNGFGWLRHFEASDQPALREQGRGLYRHWLRRMDDDPPERALSPSATARRVIAFLTHALLLTEGMDSDAYRALLQRLARDAARLAPLARRHHGGPDRVRAALALLFVSLALDGRAATRRPRAEADLAAALDEAVAPDGGPRNRCAAFAVEILSDLVPLLALYRAAGIAPPPAIAAPVLRIAEFIRLLQHPDGGLAGFHGGGRAPRDLVAQVTRFGSTRATRAVQAPETGFERLENEHALLLVDSGAEPPPGYGGQATDSALAIEFGSRTDRLIVSCGEPPGADEALRAAYRQAAASSTFVLEDDGPGRLVAERDSEGQEVLVYRSGDVFSASLRRRDPAGETLIVGHSGYRQRFGYLVERRLTLQGADGGLVGHDRLVDAEGRAETVRATWRFHLHPRVVPVPVSGGAAIVLRLPHREPGQDLWLFDAGGRLLALEESRAYLPDSIRPETRQIVLAVAASGTTDIGWRLVPYRP